MSIPAASAPRPARAHVALRIVTATLGGYGFAWGVVVAAASLLCAAGMGFHDAEFLASMFGVLALLVVFLWAFAVRSPGRALAALLVVGAALAGTGSLVQALLVG